MIQDDQLILDIHTGIWSRSAISRPLCKPVIAATVLSIPNYVEDLGTDFPYPTFPATKPTPFNGYAAVSAASIVVFLEHRFHLRTVLQQEADIMAARSEEGFEAPMAEDCEESYEHISVALPKKGLVQALFFAAAMKDLEALRIVLSGGSVSIWRRGSSIPGYMKTVAQMRFDIHANCGLGWTVLDHHTSKLWSHIDRGRGFRYRRSHSHRVLNDTKYLVVGGVACHRPNRHRLDPLGVAALLETHSRSREYPAEPFEPDFNFKALKDSKVLIDTFGKSSIKLLLDHGSGLSNSGALWTAIQHRRFWSLVFLLMASVDVNKRAFARTPL